MTQLSDEAKNLALFVAKTLTANKIINDKDFDIATEIAEEEIIARQAAGDYYLDHEDPISGDSLAGLIIDVMLDNGIVTEHAFDNAIKIAARKIDQYRKNAGT